MSVERPSASTRISLSGLRTLADMYDRIGQPNEARRLRWRALEQERQTLARMEAARRERARKLLAGEL